MRISKRTREQAAYLCSVAASQGGRFGYLFLAEDLGLPRVAYRLAYEAWNAVNPAGLTHAENQHAEAEAMLRTGWTPTGRW